MLNDIPLADSCDFRPQQYHRKQVNNKLLTPDLNNIPLAESGVFVVKEKKIVQEQERTKGQDAPPQNNTRKPENDSKPIVDLVFPEWDNTITSNSSDSFNLGQYSIDLFIEGESLTIEAENKASGKFYIKSYQNSETEKTFSHLFSSAVDLYENIKLAKDGHPTLSLSISDDAKITLSIITTFAGKERRIPIVLALEEANLKPAEICSKYLSKLKNFESQTEFRRGVLKVLDKLIQHNSQVDKEISENLKMVGTLKNKFDS